MATRVGVVEFEYFGRMIGCTNPTQLTERAGQRGRSNRPLVSSRCRNVRRRCRTTLGTK